MENHQRGQSFSNAARQGLDPSQTPSQPSTRVSPFASSGPVAMVNRPGAPGQFPGAAVRTNPIQLATPLVPVRRSTQGAPPTPSGAAAPSASAAAQNPLFPSPLASGSTANPFDQYSSGTAAPQFAAQQQTSYSQASSERYRSMDSIPSFQAQATPAAASVDLFPRFERSAANTLVGNSPRSSPASTLFSQDTERLFDGNDLTTPQQQLGATPGVQSTVRSSQSFSFGQTAEPPALTRAFGQGPPPPAAPFLGYADPSRSQHPSSASPSPRVGLVQRPSASASTLPSPPRIHAEVRSADALLEEFLQAPASENYLAMDGTGDSLFPDTGRSLMPEPLKMTLADIPDTLDGLDWLYRQKRWRTLTKKSLSMLQTPVNDAQFVLEVKSWWLAGLIKDSHYDTAASVLDQIGDLGDVSCMGESTFLPVRLRLLEALLHKYKGNLVEFEKKMFVLITCIRTAMSSTTGDVAVASKWLRIAQFALVNHLVAQSKFSLALRVCATVDVHSLGDLERVVVLSRFGRVHLQMGDLGTAESLFRLARSVAEAAGGQTTAAAAAELEARLLVNDGLLYFAQNKLQEALSAFDAAIHLDGTHTQPSTQEELFLEEDLMCVAVNNYAICALYCCDVKGAVAALERMVRTDPARFLNATVVFNLSSLYDLIYDNATSASRKEMMKKLAEMYDLEHIDPAAFRI